VTLLASHTTVAPWTCANFPALGSHSEPYYVVRGLGYVAWTPGGTAGGWTYHLSSLPADGGRGWVQEARNQMEMGSL
jgi:hypothetical protein